MSKSARNTHYVKPKPVPLTGLEQPLVPIPDGKAEAARLATIRRRLDQLAFKCHNYLKALNMVGTLLERGIHLPDIAQALGLDAPIERASKPVQPWRLRPGSNMAVIADMLEAAGTKGVSEAEMVAEVQRLGRLGNAKDPRRSVHWTVTELRDRTKFIEQRRRADGGRWYAYGRFDVWRSRKS
jgi:hypothetical protein